jgi:hypothetical protein
MRALVRVERRDRIDKQSACRVCGKDQLTLVTVRRVHSGLCDTAEMQTTRPRIGTCALPLVIAV